MNAVATSFAFHQQTESFRDFVWREKIPVLVFGLGFTLCVAAVVLLVDPSFFYPRIQTDALLYYLKGKTFAETGTTAARLALNVPPFKYASMPGVLRSPLIAAFPDFDNQLRAIQLTNIVILDAIALMSAYIFSWVLPRARHWMAIGFAFGFAVLSPWWMGNVFLALTDAPYAAFFLASMLVAIRVIVSPKPLARMGPGIALFVLLFVMAFSFRFTEPVLLVLVAVLLKGRLGERKPRMKIVVAAAVLAVGAVAALVFFNREAFFGRYAREPLKFAVYAEKREILINLFSLAIPDQIVPGFSLGFSRLPVLDLFHAQFAATRGDVLWSLVGAFISMVVVWGVWQSRDRLMPEILLLVAVLPVLGLIMPSTPRYLMTYQPFFWIWFYEGARSVFAGIPAVFRRKIGTPAKIFALCAIAIGLAAGLRSRGISNVSSRAPAIKSIENANGYIAGVTATYRPLKTFLTTLPHDRTILVGTNAQMRWKVIANLDYYMADSGLVNVARRKDAFVVIDCGSLDFCAVFDKYEARVKDALCKVGEFDYQLVFEARASRSRARVYRLRPA